MPNNLTVDEYIIAVLVRCSTVEDAYQGLSAFFRTDISQYLEITNILSLDEYIVSAQGQYSELKSSPEVASDAHKEFIKWRDFFQDGQEIGKIIIELLSDLDIRGALYAQEMPLIYLQNIAELCRDRSLKVGGLKDMLLPISDALFQPYYLIPQQQEFELLTMTKQEILRSKSAESISSPEIRRTFENRLTLKAQHLEVREELLTARKDKADRISQAHQFATTVEIRESFRAFSLRVMRQVRNIEQLPEFFSLLGRREFSHVVEKYSQVLTDLELLVNNLQIKYINDILKILESNEESGVICLKYLVAILRNDKEGIHNRFVALASTVDLPCMLAMAKMPNSNDFTTALLSQVDFACEEENGEVWTRKEFVCQLLMMFANNELMDLLANEKIDAAQITVMANMYVESGEIINYQAFLKIFELSWLLQTLRSGGIDYAQVLRLIEVIGFLNAKKILCYMEENHNLAVFNIAVKYIHDIDNISNKGLREKIRRQLAVFYESLEKEQLLLPFSSGLSLLPFLHKITLESRNGLPQLSEQVSVVVALPEQFIALMRSFVESASLHKLLTENLISSSQVIDLWYSAVIVNSYEDDYFAQFLTFLGSEFTYLHLQGGIFGWGEIKYAYNYSVSLCETVIQESPILSELVDFGDLYSAYFHFKTDKIGEIIAETAKLVSSEYNQLSYLGQQLKQRDIYRSHRFNRQIEFLSFVLHLHNFLELSQEQTCSVVDNVCNANFATFASRVLNLSAIDKPEIKRRFLLDFMLDVAPFIPSSSKSNVDSFNDFVKSLRNPKLLQIIIDLFDVAKNNDLLLQNLHNNILNLIFSSDHFGKELGMQMQALAKAGGELSPPSAPDFPLLSVHTLEEVLLHFQEQSRSGELSSSEKVQCELLLKKYLSFFEREAILLSEPPLYQPPRPRSTSSPT